MLRLTACSTFLLLLACKSPDAPVLKPPPEPFVAALDVRPVAVSLLPGATQVFNAEINYPEGVRYMRQPVAWEVVEPAGGTINRAGLYTAPAAAGVYHVKASREDFPAVTAMATVTVK